MKKIVLLAVTCTMFIGWSSTIQAQSCEDILRPFYMLNNIDPNEYPEGKADWRCQFARTAFYMCDKIPEGAPVYNISEVTDLIARRHLDGNFKVNLEEMSYYVPRFSAEERQAHGLLPSERQQQLQILGSTVDD